MDAVDLADRAIGVLDDEQRAGLADLKLDLVQLVDLGIGEVPEGP